MKVYLKVGKHGAKEKQMVAEIEAAIAKKKELDPSFDFNPADDFEDLKKLHREMVSEYVDFTEHNGKESTEHVLSNEKEFKLNTTKTSIEDEFHDPLNEAEPNIRNYVTEEQYEQVDQSQGPKKDVFDEPVTFQQAFEIPNANDDDQIKQRNIGGPNKEDESGAGSSRSTGSSKIKQDPINPSFNEMDKPSKNKQTKRFAKRIVGAVVMLLEKGFVWWTTKDINDAKLAEYELSGEIDLSLLLEMEDGQQATVKQFFSGQCAKFEALAKISQDDQNELADALTDVLMEKGITPTPTQVLIMSSLEIVGRQAITAFAISAQTKALLLQLQSPRGGDEDRSSGAESFSRNTPSDIDYSQHSSSNQMDHTSSGQKEQLVDVSDLKDEEDRIMNEQSDRVDVQDVEETGLSVVD